MKKILLLFALLFTILYVNNRYEIFAVNIPRGEEIEKEEGSFRVMTWNVNGPIDDEDGMVKKGILEEIVRLNPDILCFQELSLETFKKMQVSLDSIFGYTESMAIKKQQQRFWIYSRKPIRNFIRYKCVTDIDTSGLVNRQLEEIDKIKKGLPIFSAEIEVNFDQWITVFVCHLRSSAYSTARRSMAEGSSWKEGLPLYIDNYKTGAMIRNFEADNFRVFLDSLETKDVPVVIAGDFNDWSGSYCMNTIRDGRYKDVWWEGGFGFGITYDEWHLKLRLDHILYSNHFRLENVLVSQIPFSDHYPLVADFTL